MSYAGLARGGQRADLINYLHTLSDNPVPLPKAADAAPAAPATEKN
jgi:cytochrome c